MVLTIKVKKSEAEKIKRFLIDKKIYNADYITSSDSENVYFPIRQLEKLPINLKKYKTVNKLLKKIIKKLSLKQALKNKLSKREQNHLKTSYDVVGDMAIIEIDDELSKKEKLIGQTLLNINPSINKVAKKAGIHEGVYRLQKLKMIAGPRDKNVTYKENNVILKFNPEKVYFSPRLSTERKRICQKVKKGETILVMFSGCAPYPAVISKNSAAKEIIGIEINPEAHKSALKNININKIDNVKLYLGDVKKVVPMLKKKFDRILMPLPKSAEDFLETALSVSKKGTIIHFYDFLDEKDFGLAEHKVKKACKKANLKYEVLDLVKCGQHAPHIYRICLDFQIL